MSALQTLRSNAQARWQTMTPREQRGVTVLAALLGVLLFWFIAIAPALNTLRDTDLRRAKVEQQHAHMLALEAQAKALQTRTHISRDEALRQLQSLTPNTQMQLHVQGDRVTVQLKAVPATVLADWLAQTRHQAQALPLEAHLTRSHAEAVVWDGNMVLSLPHRGTAP